MKFNYADTLATDNKGCALKRPVVEVELLGKNKNIKALGLIDSGADATMMNIEYARELGIELDSSRTRQYLGIGGKRNVCYLAPVTLKVKHFDHPVEIIVAFIDSPSVDVLFGQEDFFDQFRIKFEKDHYVFELNLSPTARN